MGAGLAFTLSGSAAFADPGTTDTGQAQEMGRSHDKAEKGCGMGKCGDSRKAHKKDHEGKCGKKKAAKGKTSEGKCGQAKCGGSK